MTTPQNPHVHSNMTQARVEIGPVVPPPFEHGVECPGYPVPYPITAGPEIADRVSMIRLLYSIDANIKRQDAVLRQTIRSEVTENLRIYELRFLLALSQLEKIAEAVQKSEERLGAFQQILENAIYKDETYGFEGSIRVFDTNA